MSINGMKLFTDGEVATTKNRKFTRVLGGFNNKESSLTDIQLSVLLNYKHGEIGRASCREREALKTVGYTEQSINLSKSIYLFSKSGFLLFLKFAEGDKAVELYKDFIEEYFKIKAENEVMKETIEKEIEELIKDRATCLGMSLIESDSKKKLELAEKSEELNRRIIELEKTKSEEEIIKKVQDKINIADSLCTGKHDYDIGKFSKVLGVQGLGRNKLFEWMRNNKILDCR